MKKIWLILGMFACIFTITACSSETVKKAAFEYDAEELELTAKEYFAKWNEMNFADILSEYDSKLDATTLAMYKSWDKMQKEMGMFISVEDTKIVESEDTVDVIVRGKYQKGQMNLIVTFDSNSNARDVRAEKCDTMVDKVKEILVNIALGIGIVFLALIFIFGIISLFKFIPAALGRQSDPNKDNKVDHVIASIMKQEEELSGNLELVAVITAAIMASLGDEAPADGLIVRSIKRRNSKHWKKA